MAALGFMEPVRARFGGLVADMSPRDRSLFLGLVVAGYGGALFMAFWFGSGFIGDLNSRVVSKGATLSHLQELEGEYSANSTKVEAIEAQLRKSADQDFQAYVEKAASKTGISSNLKAVREKGQNEVGNLQEKTYSVDLTPVTLQQLTDFLYELEAGGFPLRIHTTRIKTTGAAGSRLVSVAMELSAFHLNEVAPVAAPAEAP
jgi:type II secretory pathway component PulM